MYLKNTAIFSKKLIKKYSSETRHNAQSFRDRNKFFFEKHPPQKGRGVDVLHENRISNYMLYDQLFPDLPYESFWAAL